VGRQRTDRRAPRTGAAARFGRWSRVPGRVWKTLLGIGALAGVILSVAGVVGLFSSDDPPKPVRPVVDRIEAAASRYGNSLGRAVALREVVGHDAFSRWTSESARIEAALRADFPGQVESWRRYDEALRTAQLVLDANATSIGSDEFRALQARKLVDLAGVGDEGILIDPDHTDYDLEWATVLGQLDEQRTKLVDDLIAEA
jgi:hypothetical protein